MQSGFHFWRSRGPKCSRGCIFGARGAQNAIEVARFRCVGPAAVRLPGLRTKVCHLGFAWPRSCAAPLLRGPAGLGASAPQLCGSGFRVNFQCCCFFLQGTKNATTTASSGPGAGKMQPLLRFGAPGGENCSPYSVFGSQGMKHATPITFSGSKGRKMQPLLRFRAPGPE